MILAPPKELGRAALATPAAHSRTHTQHSTLGNTRSQRLPAYGRRLRDALEAGYRPWKAGGSIIVTTAWNYARGFDPARLVCPSDERIAEYDFAFLRGLEVLVLVPESDELHGEALRTAIFNAGAALVVLAVNREGAS